MTILRVKKSLLRSASDLALVRYEPEQEDTLHGVANGHGAYESFDACTVRVCGQQQRGARATCGYCPTTNTVRVNTFAHGSGEDDEKVERHVRRKFEALGWKVGRTAKDNRCPKCFSAIKLAAKNRQRAKEREEAMTHPAPDEKVVPMKPAIEPHRALTRDDRRIIFNKIDEVYAGEKVGYSAGWNDERIAKDLGVPRGWVAKIRDENFGPDVDERETQVLVEAKALLTEIKAIGAQAEPIVRKLNELLDRSDGLAAMVKAIEERRK
jgi:hypothetical protein